MRTSIYLNTLKTSNIQDLLRMLFWTFPLVSRAIQAQDRFSFVRNLKCTERLIGNIARTFYRLRNPLIAQANKFP